jgi:hypothetical protein
MLAFDFVTFRIVLGRDIQYWRFGVAAQWPVLQATDRRRSMIERRRRESFSSTGTSFSMATVEHEHSTDFAIESQADTLLSQFSDSISNVMLRLALSRSTRRTSDGRPVITSDDVIATARVLSEALERIAPDDAATTPDAVKDFKRTLSALK